MVVTVGQLDHKTGLPVPGSGKLWAYQALDIQLVHIGAFGSFTLQQAIAMSFTTNESLWKSMSTLLEKAVSNTLLGIPSVALPGSVSGLRPHHLLQNIYDRCLKQE